MISIPFDERLDTAILNRVYAGNAQYAEHIFAHYLEGIDQYLTQITVSMKNCDYKQGAITSHLLVNWMNGVGLTELQPILKTMEEQFQQGKKEDLPQSLAALTAAEKEKRPIVEAQHIRLQELLSMR
ncbi:hypothetical protein [Chitinophaga flava]|uniref:HPt domain-containing protein n=1 Tax=Chitinophaga flava TaxID=2259036 RepID=A0A365XV92_9BACT|nr:hypothetical protein [Chitinophaga flava]RBL90287.1 hypothetical protein DF182_27875 [Chitinophaga flava]